MATPFPPFPEADPGLAQGLQEAQKTQMQQALQNLAATSSQSAGGTLNPNAWQTAGSLEQKQLGDIRNQTFQQANQATAARGQTALSQMKTAGVKQITQQEVALSEQSRNYATTLGRVSQQLKSKLVDEQLQFRSDAAGRQLLTTRQLSDWAILNSQNQEEYNNKMQILEQAGKRQIQIMQQAHDVIQQTIQEGAIRGKQITDEHIKEELNTNLNNSELAIARMRANLANNMAMFTAGGSLVGAGIGAVVPGGGAVGAILGSSIGGAVGSIVGGKF